MAINFNHNYFELFGQSPAFAIDGDALEASYRELQAQVHPDKFAHLSEADRRVSMQWATRVNEAYQTLKKPLSRAAYLLELRGVDVAHQTNTVMNPAFLMEQMEWREAVEEARAAQDGAELEKLRHRLLAHAAGVAQEIATHLDATPNTTAAADAVRRLMFVDKLRQDIDNLLEELDY